MRPAETSKAENGAPGKSGPSVVAFPKPKASAPKHHHPDLYKRRPPERSEGLRFCRSVTEPAPSPRPWVSAWARPLANTFTLAANSSSAPETGHFYFAGIRTFLLCLDTEFGIVSRQSREGGRDSEARRVQGFRTGVGLRVFNKRAQTQERGVF